MQHIARYLNNLRRLLDETTQNDQETVSKAVQQNREPHSQQKRQARANARRNPTDVNKAG